MHGKHKQKPVTLHCSCDCLLSLTFSSYIQAQLFNVETKLSFVQCINVTNSSLVIYLLHYLHFLFKLQLFNVNFHFPCNCHLLQDKKSVESCCVAFARLVDSFQTNQVRIIENFQPRMQFPFSFWIL